jgi:hypothetical protein
MWYSTTTSGEVEIKLIGGKVAAVQPTAAATASPSGSSK